MALLAGTVVAPAAARVVARTGLVGRLERQPAGPAERHVRKRGVRLGNDLLRRWQLRRRRSDGAVERHGLVDRAASRDGCPPLRRRVPECHQLLRRRLRPHRRDRTRPIIESWDGSDVVRRAEPGDRGAGGARVDRVREPDELFRGRARRPEPRRAVGRRDVVDRREPASGEVEEQLLRRRGLRDRNGLLRGRHLVRRQLFASAHRALERDRVVDRRQPGSDQ